MKLAAPLKDRLGDQDVRAASQRAVGDQHIGFVEDGLDLLGQLLFGLPARLEHMPTEMDHRRRLDRSQQRPAHLIRHRQLTGNQGYLAGSGSDHAGRGVGAAPSLCIERGRPLDLAANQHRFRRRGSGIIILRFRDVGPPADRLSQSARVLDISGQQ